MVSTEVPSEVRPGGGREPDLPKRSGWLGVLTFLVFAWLLVFVVPTYLTLNPAKSVIALRPGFPLHYPLLIVHVLTGTIAMVAGLVQMSARMRAKRPGVHRLSGRVYVFAVLLGAPALAALIVLRAGDLGTTTKATIVGFSLLEILWVATTVTGFVRARQRRFTDHRRMMIYSYAMTLSIAWSRIAFVIAFGIPGANLAWVADNVGWFPWVFNLVIAQLWLNRTAGRPLRGMPASVLARR